MLAPLTQSTDRAARRDLSTIRDFNGMGDDGSGKRILPVARTSHGEESVGRVDEEEIHFQLDCIYAVCDFTISRANSRQEGSGRKQQQVSRGSPRQV